MVKLQGRKNALEYISNKYGQTATIKRSKVKWDTGFTSPGCLPEFRNIGPDGDLYCEMKMDGHYFDLEVEGDRSDYKGFDNYEKDLICDEIIKDVEARLGIACTDSYIEYKEMGNYRDMYYLNLKYDTLPKFYNKCHTVVYLGTTDLLDEEKIKDYYDAYELKEEGGYLKLVLIRYDDMGYAYSVQK